MGCYLDVPAIAGTLQGSVSVIIGADWAGDVKNRRSNSGIAVLVKGSVEDTWYPVYASSKKQNMVCLSSGESELMALVGGACEGIATRDQCPVHGQRSSTRIREAEGRKSTHSSRGHEGLLHAGLGNGTWTAQFEG